jgi:hypothetical protein
MADCCRIYADPDQLDIETTPALPAQRRGLR